MSMASERAFDASLAFMAAGPILLVLAVAALRPRRRLILAGLAAGFVLAVSNFAIEVIASRAGWYRVRGALPVAGVAVSTNLAWLFLGWAFCLLWGSLPRGRRSLLARGLLVLLSPVAGVLYDLEIASRSLRLVEFSPRMGWGRIGAIWLALTLLTVLVLEAALRVGGRGARP